VAACASSDAEKTNGGVEVRFQEGGDAVEHLQREFPPSAVRNQRGETVEYLQVVIDNLTASIIVEKPAGVVDSLLTNLRERFPIGARFRLGAKLLDFGRDIGEYVADHMSIIQVLLPLVGGKGKKKSQVVAVSQRHEARHDEAPAKMSKCALKLALAMANPFDPACAGVCGIGGSSSADTLKSTVSKRFTVSVGVNGYGYIWISPCLAMDGGCIFSTDATYNGGANADLTSAPNVLATGVNEIAVNQLPFTNGYLTGSTTSNGVAVAGRILASGLTGQYIGTALDRGGMIVTHRSPLHANESVKQNATGGVTTFNTVLGYADSDEIFGPAHGDIWLNDFPTDDVERSFQTGDSTNLEVVYPYSSNENLLGNVTYVSSCGSGAPVGSPTMIICIQGTPGNSYAMEYIQHSEYLSPGGFSDRNNSATRVELDTDGHEHLLNSLGNMKGKTKPRDRWKFLRQALHKSITVAAGVIIPATEAQLSAMLL